VFLSLFSSSGIVSIWHLFRYYLYIIRIAQNSVILLSALQQRDPKFCHLFLTTVMPKAKRNAKVVDSSTNRRRSARHATLDAHEAVHKREDERGENENETETETGAEIEKKMPKADNKRERAASPFSATERRRSKRTKPNRSGEDEQIKVEAEEEEKENKDVKLEANEDDAFPALASTPVKVKAEAEADEDDDDDTLHKLSKAKPSKTKSKTDDLQAKKLKSYAQFVGQSPFPDFPRPRPDECKLAYRVLASLHGEPERPTADRALTVAPALRAGCGDSPSVLDALVRTILSQNTSDANSSRAKLSMDRAYGRSDAWAAVVAGGQAKLQKAIECGGLAAVKSRVILGILEQTHARYGAYSLDHLFDKSDDEAMREMIAFKGVGPKTASCVLLFCLRRASFAVDTHVHRITGTLGWRPPKATRDQTYAHLDARIPDEDKYGLHVLMVRHGKECEECRAGAKNGRLGQAGGCKLRNAFRKGRIKGEAGEEAKEEEIKQMEAGEDSDEEKRIINSEDRT
jgi:endonuclease III